VSRRSPARKIFDSDRIAAGDEMLLAQSFFSTLQAALSLTDDPCATAGAGSTVHPAPLVNRVV
jgi:hypothetical protein